MKLKLKTPKNYYRWQPEMALSIIFWSLTFGLFFLSIVSALEANHITYLSVFIFLFFLLVVLIGLQRFFVLEGSNVYFKTLVKKNSLIFSITDIKKISVGSHGITLLFSASTEQKTLEVMMWESTRQHFLAALQKSEYFTAEIEEM